MKALAWVIRFALFLVVLVFSIRNTDLVSVKWLPGLEVQTPLVVALLVAFLLGALFAWFSLLPSWLMARRNAAVSARQAEKAERELNQVQAAQNSPAALSNNPPQNTVADSPLLPMGPTHGI